MARDSIEYRRLEAASLRYDVKAAIEQAATAGKALGYVGDAAHDALLDQFANSDPQELRSAAFRMRGVVLHGMTVLAELQACAGRLEQLASILECLTPE